MLKEENFAGNIIINLASLPDHRKALKKHEKIFVGVLTPEGEYVKFVAHSDATYSDILGDYTGSTEGYDCFYPNSHKKGKEF